MQARAPLAKACHCRHPVDFDGQKRWSNPVLLTRKSEQFGITNVMPFAH